MGSWEIHLIDVNHIVVKHVLISIFCAKNVQITTQKNQKADMLVFIHMKIWQLFFIL